MTKIRNVAYLPERGDDEIDPVEVDKARVALETLLMFRTEDGLLPVSREALGAVLPLAKRKLATMAA